MADVASSVRERGQLILIGGLSLAVVFVALALVLNSAIYTENLATRTSDNPADTATQFRHDALAGAGTVIDYANRNGGDRTYSDRYSEYQNSVDKWQGLHANYSAINGLFTDVRAPDGAGNEGTRVADDNPDSDYTSATDQSDWTVANDAQVRLFRMNVDKGDFPSSLDDGTVESTLKDSGDAAFYAEFDGDANTWRVAVYRDSDTDEVKVMSYDSSSETTRTCTAVGSSVQIDISGGTLDGTHCKALSFMDDLSNTHAISYSNAHLIFGTYELTVGRVEGPFRSEVDAENGDSTYYNSPTDGTPYTTPAIYSATIELVYDGPSVNYETEVRVAPGEPGESAVTPPVNHLDTFGESGDTGPFDASMSVSQSVANWYTVEDAVTNDGTGDSLIDRDAFGNGITRRSP